MNIMVIERRKKLESGRWGKWSPWTMCDSPRDAAGDVRYWSSLPDYKHMQFRASRYERLAADAASRRGEP